MNYKIIDSTIILSLDKNDFINESIKRIFKQDKLAFGWVSGIGAIYNIEKRNRNGNINRNNQNDNNSINNGCILFVILITTKMTLPEGSQDVF